MHSVYNSSILAIDFGQSRTGFAVSYDFLAEPVGVAYVQKQQGVVPSDVLTPEVFWQWQPLSAYASEDGQPVLTTLLAIIQLLVKQLRVSRILVGMPEGVRVQPTQGLIAVLEADLTLPIDSWDETFSSKAAVEKLHDAGRKTGQIPIDAHAAAVFLQDYLDSRPND